MREVNRLVEYGAVHVQIGDEELVDLNRELQGELDKATRGISNTMDELEKNKGQQSKQAETITTLTERVKQAATLLRSLQGSSGDLAEEVERWLAADSEQVADPPPAAEPVAETTDDCSQTLETKTETVAEPPLATETITEPPQKRKRGRPPQDRSNDPSPPAKRPRGRPPKNRDAETVPQQEAVQETAEV